MFKHLDAGLDGSSLVVESLELILQLLEGVVPAHVGHGGGEDTNFALVGGDLALVSGDFGDRGAEGFNLGFVVGAVRDEGVEFAALLQEIFFGSAEILNLAF